MTECINSAAQTGLYDVILTSFNYAMWDDKHIFNALKNAFSQKIGIIAMKTQCTQYSYRDSVPGNQLPYYRGHIMQTAVLKWVLRYPWITTAVPGFSTFQQMEEDFSVAYDIEYTPEEKDFVENRNVKLSLGYCRQCGRCVPSCPKNVDIPSLMRTHIYTACYANFYQAKDTMDGIPKERDLHNCRLCDHCTATCVCQIDIDRRIDELKTIYC
jgi:predicted aldo/keto reductase-like oxidoreductase